ncbi:DMT family transporter [Actinoplanes couchii]|uniref:QacE family quaternary ammonium compound efflux SMR transporter n=1 Tax=Actinoplanes couchii TaxID=403638 RepID=A0ABQ3XSQ6_9ACTN|nr:multidrug efflux SMR transporter [Actinoplanes couchii]MDR6318564.1 quaternary ammonium compound-resistance protein SugE [Actinoplanes couchii]GID61503.1 QacE family quaternary ammonium compound efflux SMR transporter [Actinoplanes couchii]
MAWIVLVVSALLEAVWATALGASDGFTNLVPSLVFAGTLVVSMVTLAYVVKHIPMSVAYAIWSGLGAAFTVAWAMITGGEAVSVLKVVFLAGIIVCIAGLKLLKPPAPAL